MPLDHEAGKRMLQLITSRYDQREWRKKIEKTLSLPATGVSDDVQRAIFLYLKHGLKAYKSRRADPDSWIVGGYATKEVVERVKFNPAEVGATVAKEDVAGLGVDPGQDVDTAWWDEMLVTWFEEPEAEAIESEGAEESQPAADSKVKSTEA
ncbi:MAG: hypothetical protein EPO64_10690 [Nitrospirae bacterium]|nr:MAG: hypothetical protein EPO64_10690 [Nitrospirota bacterium]